MSFGIIPVVQFGTANAGIVPASPGGTSAFLRADGTWATPPVGGMFASAITVPTKVGSGFTNATNSVVTDNAGSGFIIVPSSAAGGMAWKTPPATPYSYTALLAPTGIDTVAALGLSDGTKVSIIYVASLLDSAANAGHIKIDNWDSFPPLAGFHSVYDQGAGQVKQYNWLRVRNDGTNITYSISNDGVNFLGITTVLVGSFLGAITRAVILSSNGGNVSVMSLLQGS